MNNLKNKVPRIYIEDNFKINNIYCLSKDNVHYVKKVLRMKVQDLVEIFNNSNYTFLSKIIYIFNEIVKVEILEKKLKNVESPLRIHLGQVISKHEKIDFIIQKSIEMGVNVITPLFSEYCNVQKKYFNISQKIKRWKKIIISSCKQCNRNIIPEIQYPKDIFLWCQDNQKYDTKIIFHPKSLLTIRQLPKKVKNIKIIIGPEGGFSEKEVQKIIKYEFIPIKLGPRILKTETATIATISSLQVIFGDFS